MEIAVKKDDLIWIQKRGFLKDLDVVNNIWQELCTRCTSMEKNKGNQETKTELVVPEVSEKFVGSIPQVDICVAFSLQNGVDIAKLIINKIQKKGISVVSAVPPISNDKESKISLEDIGKRVANSTCLVVILTSKCLQQLEVVFAMKAAKKYFKNLSQVILVHDAGSCLFPGYDEHPPSVKDLFSEKAVTFLKCYANKGVDELIDKFKGEKLAVENAIKNDVESNNETPKTTSIETTASPNNEKSHDDHVVTEDIWTRVFLSHKRSTGQGIAGRLYEGLKDRYKIFLDSEAKFKIHNLKLIVQSTEIFVFILSGGITLSVWCLEELKSAIAKNKKIIIVRDLSYTLPDVLPPEWQEVESVIRSPENELIWLAEYNAACIEELKKKIGPNDQSFKDAQEMLRSNPSILQQIKENQTLELGYCKKGGVAGALLMFSHGQVKHLDFRNCSLSVEDAECIAHSIDYLESIRLETLGTSGVTDDIFKMWSFPVANLQKLILSSSSSLTDQGLKFISDACPNLLELGLYECSTTDQGLKFISEGCHNLQALNLSYTRVSDEGFKFISEGCPKLQKLYSFGNYHGQGLEFIKNGCPNVEILTR